VCRVSGVARAETLHTRRDRGVKLSEEEKTAYPDGQASVL
jgi:hypothetical protein